MKNYALKVVHEPASGRDLIVANLRDMDALELRETGHAREVLSVAAAKAAASGETKERVLEERPFFGLFQAGLARHAKAWKLKKNYDVLRFEPRRFS